MVDVCEICHAQIHLGKLRPDLRTGGPISLALWERFEFHRAERVEAGPGTSHCLRSHHRVFDGDESCHRCRAEDLQLVALSTRWEG